MGEHWTVAGSNYDPNAEGRFPSPQTPAAPPRQPKRPPSFSVYPAAAREAALRDAERRQPTTAKGKVALAAWSLFVVFIGVPLVIVLLLRAIGLA